MAARSPSLSEALFGLASVAVRNRQRELSLTSLSTLATLERTGARRLTDLAVCEGVAQPSMTALVTQLERQGLVERRRHAGDGRVVLVTITTAGRRHLRDLRRAGAAAFDVLLDKLPEPRSAELEAALPALRLLLQFADGGGPGDAAVTGPAGA